MIILFPCFIPWHRGVSVSIGGETTTSPTRFQQQAAVTQRPCHTSANVPPSPARTTPSSAPSPFFLFYASPSNLPLHIFFFLLNSALSSQPDLPPPMAAHIIRAGVNKSSLAGLRQPKQFVWDWVCGSDNWFQRMWWSNWWVNILGAVAKWEKEQEVFSNVSFNVSL